MKLLLKILSLLAVVWLSIPAGLADNGCPGSMEPSRVPAGPEQQARVLGCAPANAHAVSSSSSVSSASSSSPPVTQWAQRWGALAFSRGDAAGHKSVLVDASNETSQELASRAALQRCQAQGGQSCRVSLVYANQCVVIVRGDVSASYAVDPVPEKAAQKAMAVCHQRNRQCTVSRTGCSMPISVSVGAAT